VPASVAAARATNKARSIPPALDVLKDIVEAHGPDGLVGPPSAGNTKRTRTKSSQPTSGINAVLALLPNLLLMIQSNKTVSSAALDLARAIQASGSQGKAAIDELVSKHSAKATGSAKESWELIRKELGGTAVAAPDQDSTSSGAAQGGGGSRSASPPIAPGAGSASQSESGPSGDVPAVSVSSAPSVNDVRVSESDFASAGDGDDVTAKLERYELEDELKSKKWKQRNDAILSVLAVIQPVAKLSGSPSVYSRVGTALAKGCNDKHPIVQVSACITSLAMCERLRSEFPAREAAQIFAGALVLHKERKSTVIEAARAICISLLHYHCVKVEDEAESIQKSCVKGSPMQKQQIMQTVAEAVNHPGVFTKKDVSTLAGPGGMAATAFNLSSDRNPGVRTGAESACAALLGRLGEEHKAMRRHLEALKSGNAKAYERILKLASETS